MEISWTIKMEKKKQICPYHWDKGWNNLTMWGLKFPAMIATSHSSIFPVFTGLVCSLYPQRDSKPLGSFAPTYFLPAWTPQTTFSVRLFLMIMSLGPSSRDNDTHFLVPWSLISMLVRGEGEPGTERTPPDLQGNLINVNSHGQWYWLGLHYFFVSVKCLNNKDLYFETHI